MIFHSPSANFITPFRPQRFVGLVQDDIMFPWTGPIAIFIFILFLLLSAKTYADIVQWRHFCFSLYKT